MYVSAPLKRAMAPCNDVDSSLIRVYTFSSLGAPGEGGLWMFYFEEEWRIISGVTGDRAVISGTPRPSEKCLNNVA